MPKSKHNPDANKLVDDYFASAADTIKEICQKLRSIVLKSDLNIIEDWKWGPNYYCDGMVCGIGAFKEHVTLTFFQGAVLSDPHKLLQQNPGNIHNRHIKFRSSKDIKATIISTYIKEAIANNKKGVVVVTSKDKTVAIPSAMKSALKDAKLLEMFEKMSYSCRKEYAQWIGSAKRPETISNRVEKMIAMVRENKGVHSKYKK